MSKISVRSWETSDSGVKLAGIRSYTIKRWKKLIRYLDNGRLEIDNNLIENAIRPLALGRKNYLFAGNHDAAANIANFYTIFGTCKKLGINPHYSSEMNNLTINYSISF